MEIAIVDLLYEDFTIFFDVFCMSSTIDAVTFIFSTLIDQNAKFITLTSIADPFWIFSLENFQDHNSEVNFHYLISRINANSKTIIVKQSN